MVLAEGPRRYSLRQGAEGIFHPPFDDYDYLVEIRSQGDWAPYVVRATVGWEDRNGPKQTFVETLIAPRQGEEDDWTNWRPDEPLDRESRSWDEEEEEDTGGLP